MPKTEKQRKAACARAHGKSSVMKSMPKAKAKEWCRSKPERGK